MTSHQNESNLSLFLFVFFVISLQNWNHFPFPAKSSPPSFFYVKQLSQTNKNQFIESSPCPTIGTAQKRNLHIFGPKTHGCKEGGPPCLNGSLRKTNMGGSSSPQTRTAWWLNHPTHLKKYALLVTLGSSEFHNFREEHSKKCSSCHRSYRVSPFWRCEGVTHLKTPMNPRKNSDAKNRNLQPSDDEMIIIQVNHHLDLQERIAKFLYLEGKETQFSGGSQRPNIRRPLAFVEGEAKRDAKTTRRFAGGWCFAYSFEGFHW